MENTLSVYGERMLSRAQVPQLSVDPGSAAVNAK